MEENHDDKMRKVRNLRLAALSVALAGGVFALATGTWRDGVLGLAISLAVAIFGYTERVRGEDRAIGLVLMIVGILGVIGHIGQILLAGLISG